MFAIMSSDGSVGIYIEILYEQAFNTPALPRRPLPHAVGGEPKSYELMLLDNPLAVFVIFICTEVMISRLNEMIREDMSIVQPS